MGLTNINAMVDMTKSFLEGEIDDISYGLDFPYEIEKCYRKMVREDREYAELIFDCLIEEGTNKYDELTDTRIWDWLGRKLMPLVSICFLYMVNPCGIYVDNYIYIAGKLH
ncbi:hypothetical protein [Desulfitobacterium sp.]|uniref:hypothetical protein n=1 Tax=Desulfitobacterium sp. TaxID=49981 RepID=UPI002B205047|nr:hypothetical protein [Desulfitobacterium sp.]MEA4901435.1 hypothetical protein [Desulfitobacterium sp.]